MKYKDSAFLLLLLYMRRIKSENYIIFHIFLPAKHLCHKYEENNLTERRKIRMRGTEI